MKRVAITGAKGVIGRVLTKGLSDYKLTFLDLPEVDVRKYEKLLKILPGHDAVIHLAWDTKTENFRSGRINSDNKLMIRNVYKAAIETKVPRVIMPSSVHADNFYDWKGPGLISPNRKPIPDSPYGKSKIYMEKLGRDYAKKGLEVICIRFGWVNLENKPYSNNHHENLVWLSNGDCVGLVKKCIEAKNIPNNFLIIYGVSNNKNRIHDYSNLLGWRPKDNAGI